MCRCGGVHREPTVALAVEFRIPSPNGWAGLTGKPCALQPHWAEINQHQMQPRLAVPGKTRDGFVRGLRQNANHFPCRRSIFSESGSVSPQALTRLCPAVFTLAHRAFDTVALAHVAGDFPARTHRQAGSKMTQNKSAFANAICKRHLQALCRPALQAFAEPSPSP